ncbi:MAG TPA: trehalose-phosphatase [Acidimicrobiales bacterium]|nr:trehalose-phosphatase [Acidimicrobiales bacterium]
MLTPLLEDPVRTALVCDYDGTLSPIVDDPDDARPAAGAVEVLSDLSRRFGVVAVVSGRRLSFLLRQLDGTPPSVRMVGLYGLEHRGPEGVGVDPEAAAWTPVVREVVDRLRASQPPGVLVEDKEFGVTVHWRRAPEAATWAESTAAREAKRSGLRAQPGKMAVELRLPLAMDKGTVVRELAAEAGAALYVGDDSGDLPAFRALTRLADERGAAAVTAAVVGPETPPDLLEAADLTIPSPGDAVNLLRWLADRAGGG